MAEVYDSIDQLPDGLLESCGEMPLPTTVLMCPPTYFDVVDVKNPHMEGSLGRVNFDLADRQWQEVRDAFIRCGARVETLEPLENCEDMVFCANQTLAGLDVEGQRVCLLSQMKHASRQREVPAFAEWFAAQGYQVEHLPGEERFEGSGDAVWHPGRSLIWGGHGFRTDPAVYEAVSDYFAAPVLRLKLHSDHFYHLDTSFCAINERTAMIYPSAFDEQGLGLIRAVFSDVIEVSEHEALRGFACNATPIGGRCVVIQRGNARAVAQLRERGLEVHEVDTSEFMKSGGSVFCMKMYVF